MTAINGFEWDARKRDSNVKKHGLDFVDAVTIFEDPKCAHRIDNRNHYLEIRYQSIGKLRGEDLIVIVVWTYREQNKRIISARIAHLKERILYNEKQN